MKKIIFLFVIVLAVFNVNAQDMFTAIKAGDTVAVDKLLKEGISVDVTDSRGYTPLILSVYNNEKLMTEFLMSRGANVNGVDESGNTALMGAIFKGNKELASMLINHPQIDINQLNLNGATALIFAATFGQIEIAQLLLNKGADKSIKDKLGNTAYKYAAIQEHEEMISLLK